ncbi:hypothetical protein UFOVP662_19 [uncultured Caudovirales phage]|uniref:Uncharacterized protein n=1 Tax=uncultured Caudovirales phage TaxID=2100421 RepID=A0A6J5QA41_9CAUD|nr:hypothetical protein UFOVP662_19 [uncultured Caudovirales phage]CAB4181159.1 hypothetical protein UFOVP1067_19 [uncultured Caudovirales phage]
MTQDEIIRMAREAGPLTKGPFDDWYKRFANLVAAAEREACARICDDKYKEFPQEENDFAYAESAKGIAAAIRARGTT